MFTASSLQHGKDLPPAADLAAMLQNVLDNEHKTKIMVFLSEIAMADRNVSQEERDLLQRIASALGVQAPT
ncbi:MAG: TerB family tellurite resistance protein [Planctomycetaceae bacterium]|nr:TerB family tellurite resistance protein [Planctomycetaceae bacterium]